MRVSIIVATGLQNEIGFENKLIWHIKEDLKYFKAKTIHKTIVMGRKTYESIGKLLPDRQSIILSRDLDFKVEGAVVLNDPMMVFDYVLSLENDEDEDRECMICGGREIYELFMPYATTIYRTLVSKNFKADTFFPSIDESEWRMTNSTPGEEVQFQIYEKVLD